MTIDLRGFAVFRAGLPDAVDTGVERAADLCVVLAQQYCPVGPERENHTHLRDTIRVLPKKENGVREVAAGEMDDVDYQLFVEYGTRFMDAQPYLTPARKQTPLNRLVKEEIGRLIARSGIK